MRTDTSIASAILLGVATLFMPGAATEAGQRARPVADGRGNSQGPLAELRHKRRVYLVASSPPVNVIDARQAQDEAGYARAVIAEVFNQYASKMRRVRDAYKDLANPLIKYAKKYRSLELVERPEEADFLLVYYELGRLRLFDCYECFYKPGNYSVGHLLVLKMGSAEEPEPRVILTHGESAHGEGGYQDLHPGLENRARGEVAAQSVGDLRERPSLRTCWLR